MNVKKKLIVFLLVISLLALVAGCSDEEENETKEEQKVAVEIEKIEKGDISNSITIGGRAIPQAEMMITADSSLKVDDIKKSLGKEVEKGDVLFTLKTKDEIKEIKSPLEGTISQVNLKEDEFVPLMQAAMVIVDNKAPITISINASENLINELYIGKKVKVDIDSIEEENLDGQIVSISPTVNEQTGLYSANILLDEENRNIRPSMNASINMDTDLVENTLKIKSEAILNANGKQIVYIIKDSSAKEVEVKTGLDTGEFTEIKSGLNEGDEIVVKGQNYIEDGAKVEVLRGEENESN